MSTPQLWTARVGLRRLAYRADVADDLDVLLPFGDAVTALSGYPEPGLFDPGDLPDALPDAVAAVIGLVRDAIGVSTDPAEARALLAALGSMAEVARVLATREHAATA